jgi:hypothetical protein
MITRRPVKITLTREESFYVHRGRHPVKMLAKTGVSNDGTIQAMQYKTYLDGGGYSSYGLASVYYTGALQTVTYKVPAYKFEGVRVFTNKPACGPKRGHGTPQPRFAEEIQMDEIAEKLGIDPIELPQATGRANSTTVNGLRVSTTGLRECTERVASALSGRINSASFLRSRRRFRGSSYISGAGLRIYWNVYLRVQISSTAAVASRFLRFNRYRPGSDSIWHTLSRRVRHRSRRYQSAHRRHGSDAGGSRQLLKPRHRDDWQRRGAGLRQTETNAARSREPNAGSAAGRSRVRRREDSQR